MNKIKEWGSYIKELIASEVSKSQRLARSDLFRCNKHSRPLVLGSSAREYVGKLLGLSPKGLKP